jgi:hypothetical protein
MSNAVPDPDLMQRLESQFRLRFTPAEWRHLLEDPAFLKQGDNSFSPPRRLMGLSVEIVPDHGGE